MVKCSRPDPISILKGNITSKGWGVGFQTGAARFANSKEGISIARNDPKLTVVPLLFIAEYETKREGIVRPFFAAGLGISTYTFSYYVGPPKQNKHQLHDVATDRSTFLHYKKHDVVFKGKLCFRDGWAARRLRPQFTCQIFPESDKATGYAGIAFGFSYRFNK